MIVDNLFSSIARGKQGLNKGLSSGLPEFDTYTYGVQRRWMTVVAGDSGSGKSSLVTETLYKTIQVQLNGTKVKPGEVREVLGLGNIQDFEGIEKTRRCSNA